MWRWFQIRWVAGALAALLFPIPILAQPESGYLSTTEEDDYFWDPGGNHQDRHYTQGIKFCYMAGSDKMSGLCATLDRLLPAWGYEPDAHNLGGVCGQDMYTPQNLDTAAAITNDRPYAGWLYTGPVYQRRGQMSPSLAVMENYEINLGIVGPWSLANVAQKTVHHLEDIDIPQGWSHQLRNEPGLVLKYARLWRYTPVRYFDLIPRAGAEAGNVSIFGVAGGVARLGWNLPEDFGQQIIDSPASATGGFTKERSGPSVWVFGGGDMRAVGHDITLDGNTFRGGPSVDKYPLVFDLDYGAAASYAWKHFVMEASYTLIQRTLEFKGQHGDDFFGSLNLTFSIRW